MKKYLFVFSALLIAFGIFGCGKKEAPPIETQEVMSIEALNALNANITMFSPAGTAKIPVDPALVSSLVAGPGAAAKPSEKEIQLALKNAGYYAGAIDGKIGPKTSKAIEDFQKENGLSVDGKVGPKTWAILGKYLNSATGAVKPSR